MHKNGLAALLVLTLFPAISEVATFAGQTVKGRDKVCYYQHDGQQTRITISVISYCPPQIRI